MFFCRLTSGDRREPVVVVDGPTMLVGSVLLAVSKRLVVHYLSARCCRYVRTLSVFSVFKINLVNCGY